MQDSVYDEFAQMLTEAVAAMKVGEGIEEDVVQGPLIDEAALEKVEAHVDDAVANGAKVLTGGKRHAKGRHLFRTNRTGQCEYGDAVQPRRDLRTIGAVATFQN